MNCGNPLGEAVSAFPAKQPVGDLRLERLAAAAPAPLAEKIRAASKLAGERRVVTALFADVVDSTALAEQMDPEDWTALMNQAFDRLVPAIYRYEGTIARLMGDALLAFFGAPVAHEDDPIRAVRAGLDLIEIGHEYAREVRQSYGIDFAIRVGLNTGPVVVGEVGSNLVYEYTAMGDAVNLAARMQAAARPMTVLIAENTHRLVSPICECKDLGTISVKGKSEPVRVYAVTGIQPRPEKIRGLSGLTSRMVGRDAELASLVRLGEAVQAGVGRVAVITGEAGIGKSRLISEWRLALDESAQHTGRALAWAERKCLSYGQGLAYHLLIDLLRSILQTGPGTGEAETRQALNELGQSLFGEDSLEVTPYLGHLLSLQLEGPTLERVHILDPQGLQSRYLAALSQLLRALAMRQPLAVTLEDLHWADPSSTELLIRLLPLVGDAPILFVCICRPDRDAPGWKLIAAAWETMGAGVTEIQLHALSEKDSSTLVSNLLEIEDLPESVRNVILKKAEGNPFFVEELIRMLIDRRVLVETDGKWVAGQAIEAVDIPDNLQGLLLARIDQLPDEVKHTLRVASVIGRQFSVRVLEQVLSNSEHARV